MALSAENLTVDFGEHRALDGLSLALPTGSFLAVVGPNGSGKTTFLKVLLGLIRPTGGRVRLWQQTPQRVPPEWIGYVPQLKTLNRRFPALAIELVATGLRRAWPVWIRRGERQRSLEALERVGAAHLAERSVAQLSGGELQRVYLARALVRDPRVVMLDEPATGIDLRGEHDFYHLLEHCHEETGVTILMVTHDWAAAYHHATHALLLKARQVAFGPPHEALTDDSMREAFGHVGHTHGQPWLVGERHA